MALARRRRIKKLFIANRGEIACRIIRAAREMGIPTVAAFSDADAGSLAVRMAEEVAHLGPTDPLKSYLDQDSIIRIAKENKCNAIHPGYGFLAENATFVDKCQKAKLIFVGPTSKNIRELGDKTLAKKIAIKADVPVIPGTAEPVTSIEEAKQFADEAGYPIIMKAAAGGGGRGMRIARKASEVERSLESCRNEAMASFGSDAIFLEKLIENARHIEVQVLADSYGNVIQLGERDCSIQRRHQKLIEEAPSPALDNDTRSLIGLAACNIAREAGYRNAGTVEFLLEGKDKFYFMEMNTRIQVEHPVTEMVTGVDLVKRQLLIAQDENLDITQLDVRTVGHAIECRINAEDPSRNFLPTPGRIANVIFPLGPGIRVDTAAFSGSEIPREYDSMIAKIIVHADTREEAVERMKRALLEFKIGGIRSTANFHFSIMNDPDFISGDFNTSYIDRNLDRLNRNEFANPEIAAIASAIEAYLRTHNRLPKKDVPAIRPGGSWKLSRNL